MDLGASQKRYRRPRKFYKKLADELTLYAEHVGWLCASVKPPNAKDSKTFQRLKLMPDGDPALELPEADAGICALWAECGRCMNTGMGISPLSWQEIESYAASHIVNDFEKQMIRKMSEHYCSSLNSNDEYYAIPPGWTKQQALERNRIVNMLNQK